MLLGIGGLVCLASGIAITTFQRRPEVVGDRDTVDAGSVSAPAPKPSLIRRAIGLVERVAKFFIHYPSYILFTAIAGRIDVYLFVYVGVNAVYALRALASVALRFGRA